MTHPNNKGKGTYTEKQRQTAKTEARRAYQREWRKKNYKRLRPATLRWREQNKVSVNYSVYKHNAKNRNISFDLSKEEFTNLISLPCHYCGQEPEPLGGVDRKNNEAGYSTENCVPCCSFCNVMKMDSSYEDFVARCMKIVKRHATKIMNI